METTNELATLTLSHEEQRVLLRILNEEAGEMRTERRRTEDPRYHDELKHEYHVLEALVEKVQRLAAPHAPMA
jgi:hypothetical protein